MKVVIFGANGVAGRVLTKQALAQGHAVTAFTRHPNAFPLRDASLQVVGGDVLDPGAVGRAVAGQGAVLSTLRSEEHTSELQSLRHLVCRLLLEKKKKKTTQTNDT